MPALEVKTWLVRQPKSLDNSAGVHVISFWSSAVTPARESLLTLSKLAAVIGDPRVEVVAITTEPAEAIAPLLDSPPLQGRVTIPVGCDPDFSSYNQFMTSSWQKSLPTAFVVSGGQVQWIGSPRQLEPVLRAILDGRWSTDARREDAQRELALRARAAEFEEGIRVHLDRKEYDQVMALVARMEADPDAGLAREGSLLRVAMLQQAGKTAEALESARALMQRSRDWVVHAELARTLASELFAKPDFSLALMAALGGTRLCGEKEALAFIALAEVQARSGQRDHALKTLERAAALATPEERDFIDERLALWKYGTDDAKPPAAPTAPFPPAPPVAAP